MKSAIQQKMKKLELFEHSITPRYPEHMLLELTDVCNFKCAFCGNNKVIKKVSFMGKDFAFDILQQAYDLGARDVGLYSRGEPTLSPILGVCIEKAKQIGYDYIFIDTNGSCTLEKLNSLISKGIDSIKFSINAGTPETYKKIHGFNSFQEVIDKIIYLSAYRKASKHKVNLYVSYVVTKYNKDEKNLLKNILVDYVDGIVFNPVHTQGAAMPSNKKIRVGEDVDYLPCSMVFNRFHVTADGKLSACCVDYTDDLIMADLNKSTLKESWNNKKFQELRKKHLAKNVKGTICEVCNIKL